MYSEVAFVLVSTGFQVQPQIILDPDYLADYLSGSYNYDRLNLILNAIQGFSLFRQTKILKYTRDRNLQKQNSETIFYTVA